MRELEAIIAEEIKEKGPITFKRFMELALYHPRYGYYSKGPSIGRKGDFYTSSSVGSIFGRTLARALAEMLDVAGASTVVEMGAGTGDLAVDVIEGFREMGRDVEYLIVERSAGMRSVENERLLSLGVRQVELDGMEPVCGVFFSNELVDAFPVHLVKREGGRLREVYVDYRDGFVEVLGEPSDERIEEFFRIQQVELPEGFITEVNLEMVDWLEKLSRVLKRGFLLTIDYGYTKREFYSPVRSRGTLMCYYRHTASENPYVRVGEQDITSHVNFSALALYGERFGFRVVGFTNQANFLIDAGILELARDERELLQVKTLVMPGAGMGEMFKVLVQARGIDGEINLRSLRNAPKRESFAL